MQYTNSQIRALIDEHIHSQRDRAILARSLCDKIGYEAIAEEFGMSRSQIARIVPKGRKTVFEQMTIK